MDTPALLFQTLIDETNDGIPELIISEVYSTKGNLTERLLDRSEASGIPDALLTYTYDAQGNQTGLFVDIGNDGTIESTVTTEYAVDADGTLTVTTTSSNIAYVTVFNRDGNLVKETEAPVGAQPTSTAIYDYNESGQLTTYETTVSGTDGTYRTEYAYDTSNRIISSTFFSLDGTVSSSETYTYDEVGNFTGREYFSSALSDIRSFDIYIYDEANRLIDQTTYYDPGSGVSDVSGRYTYEYNEAGQVTRYSTSVSAIVGIPDSVSTYEYDEAGMLIQFTTDRENDGTPIYKTLYRYDDLGRLIAEESNRDADGTIDRTVIYAYDDLLTSGGSLAALSTSDADNIEVSSLVAAELEPLSTGLETNALFSNNNTVISSLENSSTLTSVETADLLTMM